MNKNLSQVKKDVYDKLQFQISELESEIEGKYYDACQFRLNGRSIISRSSKITPKKVGQFVTFWKRNEAGITEPFLETNELDFFVINVRKSDLFGQFVFPKSILIQKGIISTNQKDGKRGFRVYPIWDKTTNKQAIKTQEWQLNYFYKIDNYIDLKKVKKLYEDLKF